MAAPILLPFLDDAPYQIPLVEKASQMMTDAWQRWHVNLTRVIFGEWRDVPYSAANFTTVNPAINWVVASGNIAQLRTFQMGRYANVVYYLTGGTVSADVATLNITLPRLNVAAVPPGYPHLCRIVDGAAAPEVGFAVMSGTSTSAAQVTISKLSGANFLAASAAIEVQGSNTFECNSFVVP